MWRASLALVPGGKCALPRRSAVSASPVECAASVFRSFSDESSAGQRNNPQSAGRGTDKETPVKNGHPFTKLHRLAGTHKTGTEEGSEGRATGTEEYSSGPDRESWFGQWPTRLFRTGLEKVSVPGQEGTLRSNETANEESVSSTTKHEQVQEPESPATESTQAATSPLSGVFGGRVPFGELPSSLNEVTNTVIRTSQQVLDTTNTAVATALSTAAAPLTPNAPKTPSKEHLVYEDIKSLVKLTDWEDITAHSSSASEVTLYVKGFLQEGDSPDKFVHWMNGHRDLCDRRNWGPLAYGHHWQSGRRPQVTDFIPPVTSFLLLSRASPILKVPTPGTLAAATAASLAADAALIVWRFASQYYSAIENARVEARSLSKAIDRLTSEYTTVRIVAHSLGCRHVIEAVCELPYDRRPQEIHLLAPACRESDVADKLSHLAQGPTFLYYCQRDYILAMLFRTFSLGYALGQYGPQRHYNDLHAVDVGGHFGFYVHMYYRQVFQEFLKDSHIATQHSGDDFKREGA